MKKDLPRAFAIWLPLAVGLTGVFAFAYLAVQQNYRQSMNDSQIQMAEDAAASLARDDTAANVIPHTSAQSAAAPTIEMSSSLAPWIAIYDASGTPLESSATLDGAPPRLPPGLFDTTTWREHKKWQAPSGPETRVTWQPRPDVRQAIVLVRFDTPRGIGWVAAGRSMRTTEERVIDLTYHAAAAWGGTLLVVLVAAYIFAASV